MEGVEEDEEEFEHMYDVWFKAGERETDGIEEFNRNKTPIKRKMLIKPKTVNSWILNENVSLSEDDFPSSGNESDSSSDSMILKIDWNYPKFESLESKLSKNPFLVSDLEIVNSSFRSIQPGLCGINNMGNTKEFPTKKQTTIKELSLLSNQTAVVSSYSKKYKVSFFIKFLHKIIL